MNEGQSSGQDKELLARLLQHNARLKAKVEHDIGSPGHRNAAREPPVRESLIANMDNFSLADTNREPLPEFVEQSTRAYIHAMTKGLYADGDHHTASDAGVPPIAAGGASGSHKSKPKKDKHRTKADKDSFSNEVMKICHLLQSTEQMLLPFGQVCVEQYSYLSVCGAPQKEKLWSAVNILETVIGWVEKHILNLHYALPAGIELEALGADPPELNVSFSCVAAVIVLVNRLVESVVVILTLDFHLNSKILLALPGTEGEDELKNNMLRRAGFEETAGTGGVPLKTTGGTNTAWTNFHMDYFKEMPHIPLLASCMRVIRLQSSLMDVNSHFSLLTRDSFCGHSYAYSGAESNYGEMAQKDFLEPTTALLAEAQRLLAAAEEKGMATAAAAAEAAASISAENSSVSGTTTQLASQSSAGRDDSDSDADLLRQIGTDIDDLGLSSNESSSHGPLDRFNSSTGYTAHPSMRKSMSQQEAAWAKYKVPLAALETALCDLRVKFVVSESLELCMISPLAPSTSFRSGYRLILESSVPTDVCHEKEWQWRTVSSGFFVDLLAKEMPRQADGPLKLDILGSLNYAMYIKRIIESVHFENKFEFYNYHVDFSSCKGSQENDSNYSHDDINKSGTTSNQGDQETSSTSSQTNHSEKQQIWMQHEGARTKLLSEFLASILKEAPSDTESKEPSQLQPMSRVSNYAKARAAQASSLLLQTCLITHQMRWQLVDIQEDEKDAVVTSLLSNLANEVFEIFSSLHPEFSCTVGVLRVCLLLQGMMSLPRCVDNIESGADNYSSAYAPDVTSPMPMACDIGRWNWYQENEPPLEKPAEKTFILGGTTFVEGRFSSVFEKSTSLLDSSVHSIESDSSDILNFSDKRGYLDGEEREKDTLTLMSPNAKYALDHFTVCMSRDLAATLLPLHPEFSLFCFEIYANMFTDVYKLEYQPHELHVDMALLAARCNQQSRMHWHCRYLLTHPTVLCLEDYSLLESVINLLVTDLCKMGEWEDAIKILNNSVESVVMYVQSTAIHQVDSWSNHPSSKPGGLEYTDSANMYNSTFNVFQGTKPIIMDGNIRKLRMLKYCDNLHLRLAYIFVDFGMLDRGVDEIYTLLSTVCRRSFVEQEAAGAVKLAALSMLTKAYLALDDTDSGKKISACIKNIRHAHANASSESDKVGVDNDAGYMEAVPNHSPKTSILAHINGPWGLDDLSCNFSTFGSIPNYHEGIIPLHCTSELHINLGLVRGLLHFSAEEHMLALKSIAPTLLAVELTAVAENYSQSCLIQLADLYFLNARIQFDASKNTSHVQYPVVVTVGRVLDIVIKLHVKAQATAKAESRSNTDASSVSMSEATTASSITMDSSHYHFAGQETSGAPLEDNSSPPKGKGFNSFLNGATGSSSDHPHIMFNHSRAAQRYNSPVDMLRSSMQWCEWAMDLYKECDQLINAAKCASFLAACQLEATFVPCTFFDTPWNTARDISEIKTNSNTSYADQIQPELMQLLNAKYNRSMYGTTQSTSVFGNSRSSFSGSSEQYFAGNTTLQQISLRVVATMTDFAMGVFSESGDYLSIVNCYLHRAELYLLQDDHYLATKSFSEARDLFIHIYVDGSSIPLARRGTPLFLGELGAVLDRLVRFLWTCDPPFINDNLVLFDIHLSFTAEKELAAQRYAMAAHDLKPKLLVTIAAIDKCCADMTAKHAQKNMSNPAPGAGIVGARSMKAVGGGNAPGEGDRGYGFSSNFSTGFGPGVLMGVQSLQPQNDRETNSFGYGPGSTQSQRSGGTDHSGSHSLVLVPPGLDTRSSKRSVSSAGSDSSNSSANGSHHFSEHSGGSHTRLGHSNNSSSSGNLMHGVNQPHGSSSFMNYETLMPDNKSSSNFSGGSSSGHGSIHGSGGRGGGLGGGFGFRSDFNSLAPPPGMQGTTGGVDGSGSADSDINALPIDEPGLAQPLSLVQPGVLPPLRASEIRLRGLVKVPTVVANDMIIDERISKKIAWLAKGDASLLNEGVTSQGVLTSKAEAALVQNIWRCQCMARQMQRGAQNKSLHPKALAKHKKSIGRAMSILMTNLRTFNQLAAPEEFSYVALMRSLHDRQYPASLSPESLAAQVAVDSKVRFRRMVIALQVGGILLMYHPHTGQKHVQLYGCVDFISYAHSREFVSNFLSMSREEQLHMQRMETEQGLADRRALAGLPLFNESNYAFLPGNHGASQDMPVVSLPTTSVVPVSYLAHMRQLSVESDEVLGTYVGNESRVQFMQSLRGGLMADAANFLQHTCDPAIYLPKPVLNASMGEQIGNQVGTYVTKSPEMQGDTGPSYYSKQMEQQRVLNQQQQFQPMASKYGRGRNRAQKSQSRSGFGGITTMITRVINRFLDPNSQEGVPTLNAPITLLCSRSLQFMPWEMLVEEGECVLRASSLVALVGQLQGPDSITGPSMGSNAVFVGSAIGLPGVPVTLKNDIHAHDLVRRQIAVEHALARIYPTEKQNKSNFYTKTVIPPAIDIQNTRVPKEIIHKYKQVVRSSARQEWPCYLPLLPLGKTSILLRSKSLRQVSFVDLSVLALDGSHPNDLGSLILCADGETPQGVGLASVKAQTQVAQAPTSLSNGLGKNGSSSQLSTAKWGQWSGAPNGPPVSSPSTGEQVAVGGSTGFAQGANGVGSPTSSSLSTFAAAFNPSAPAYVPNNMRGELPPPPGRGGAPVSISYQPNNNGKKYYVMVMTYTDLVEMSTSVMHLLAHRSSKKIVCVFVPHFCVGAVVKEIVRSLEQFALTTRTEEPTNNRANKVATQQQKPYGVGGYSGYQGNMPQQEEYGGRGVPQGQGGEYAYNEGGFSQQGPDGWNQYQNNGNQKGGYSQEPAPPGPVGPNDVYSYHIIMAAVLRMQEVHATTISVFM